MERKISNTVKIQSYKILNVEPQDYSDKARNILKSIGTLYEVDIKSRKELLKLVKDIDVLIVRLRFKIDREVIDAAPKLKYIVTATTGLDHIDVKYAETRNVKVLSLRGEYEFLRKVPATAELTWGLILSLVRKIPWAFNHVKRGGWNRNLFKGHNLYGRKLGILGLGRIGEKVARYGQAFGMKVGAYDPYKDNWIRDVKKFEDIKEFLSWSDIVSIHIPYNADNKKFLDGEKMGYIKKGAYLVNTSRGGVIDECALLEFLINGHLAGAALDVVEGETEGKINRKLLEYAKTNDNLILTPHIGGATYESMHITEEFIINKLLIEINK